MTTPLLRWGDLPVPYVAAWSSESTISIGHDPLVKGPAVFRSGRRGDGKPLFGKMDESRVRRVMIERRCQVCAERFTEGYVLDKQFGRWRDRSPIMNEPLACLDCFRLSIALCPGIARMRGKPRAFASRVRRFECIAAYVQPIEGGDAELNRALAAWKGKPPIGYIRPALIDYDVLNVTDFEMRHANA